MDLKRQLLKKKKEKEDKREEFKSKINSGKKEEVVEREDLNICNKMIREESRKRLLELLEKCDDVYKSQNFYRKVCEELGNIIEMRKEIIKELEKTTNKLADHILYGNFIEKGSSFAQVTSGLVAPFFPFVPYISPLAVGAEVVDNAYKYHQERYEKKSMNKFKEKIYEDKKVQEECKLIESMLQKSETIDFELSNSL
ncbi:12188_t:CDS:2, partial [Racocetra persica]